MLTRAPSLLWGSPGFEGVIKGFHTVVIWDEQGNLI
jgi:hypothetical protein